MIHAAGVLAYI